MDDGRKLLQGRGMCSQAPFVFRCIVNNEHETRRGVRQGASYISAAKPQKCYCMGSMNVVLANVALASAGSVRPPKVTRIKICQLVIIVICRTHAKHWSY